MWHFITDPLTTALALTYASTGSIVLSIVIITIAVRMLLYPLTIRQQRMSRKQQALQPEIDKLRKKHKGNTQALLTAQQKLFVQHGMSQFDGCFSLSFTLFQIPAFVGLYQAVNLILATTPQQILDLSGRLLIPALVTEFPINGIWLGIDLTLSPLANPLYALLIPLLVFLTGWLRYRLSSASYSQNTTSPSPLRGMSFAMPVMFAAFSLGFSVGISIYFITSNVVGIFQSTVLRL